MSYKRFLINELEKKDILKQYDLLVEVATVDPEPVSTLTIDKNVQFRGGYWSETYLPETLGPEIEKVKKYLSSGAGKIYLVSVTIESGESQLPNVDNENGGKAVPPLYLATKRNESIQNYITTQLQSFVDQKLLISLPKFQVAQPKIGATPFLGTPFCPQGKTDVQQRNECVIKYRNGKTTIYKTDYADKYLKEQYVRVILKLEELTGMKKCLDNMVIEVNYTDLSKKHVCNSAIYEISLNDVKLFRDDKKPYASLNNNYNKAKNYPGLDVYDNNSTSLGGKRFNKFIITPEIASQILIQTIGKNGAEKPSFILKAKCLNPFNNKDWNGGCHKGVGNIVVTNGQKEVFNYISATPNDKDEVKNLATFNACGSGKAQ